MSLNGSNFMFLSFQQISKIMNLLCPQKKKAQFICTQQLCNSSGLKCREGCKRCNQAHDKCLHQQRLQVFSKKIAFDNKNAAQQKKKIIEELKKLRSSIDNSIKLVSQKDFSKFGVPDFLLKHQQQKFVSKLTGKQFRLFISAESAFQIKENFSPQIVNQIKQLNRRFEKSNINMLEFFDKIDSNLGKIKAQHSILQKSNKKKSREQALILTKQFIDKNYEKLMLIISQKKKLVANLCFQQSLDNSKIIEVFKILAHQILILFQQSTQLQDYQCALYAKNLIEKVYHNSIEGFQLHPSKETSNKINQTMALYFYGKKQAQFALKYYQKLQPWTYQNIRRMYELYEELKSPEQQNKYLQKLYQIKKNEPFSLKKMAEEKFKTYQFEQAEKYFIQYLRLTQDKQNIEDLQWMARLLIKISNRHKQVIRCFRRIISLNKTRIDLMYQVAQIRQNVLFNISADQAKRAYWEIVQTASTLGNEHSINAIYVIKSYNRLAKLLGSGQYEEKVKLLKQAIAIQKNLEIQYFQTHQALALEYIRKKKQDFGIIMAQLEICSKIYPKPQIYFWKGKCLMDCKQENREYLQAAQKQFSHAIKLRQQFADAFFLRGKCKLKRNKIRQALQDFLSAKGQKSVEGFPNQMVNKEILYLIGKCYEELNDQQKALQNYQWVLEKDPGHTHARYAKAILLKKDKRIDEAAKILNALVYQDTKYKLLSLMSLGDIRERIADQGEDLPIKERRTIYEQALQLHEQAYLLQVNQDTVINYCRVLEKLKQKEKSKKIRDAYQEQQRYNG